MTIEQTFEEAVTEFIAKTKEFIDTESLEGIPPNEPCPYEQEGPPYESPIRLDSNFITKYSRAIGDNNAIYTDPDYQGLDEQAFPTSPSTWVVFPVHQRTCADRNSAFAHPR